MTATIKQSHFVMQQILNSKQKQPIQSYKTNRFDEVRIRLSKPDALLQLSLLGLVTGILAGACIILFRLIVENLQDYLLPGDGPENYELLTNLEQFVLPIAAAIAIAVMFRWFGKNMSVLGIAHVMERMQYHQGHISVRGFLLQFLGAAFAIIGGHSVGREGPHVFLGAAAGSLMGQYLSLPNNTIRTFVGCGTAAGIAASFNTPLAGVVFALEVVMMEYTVASFIPVILAAVSATTLSNLVFGPETSFVVPSMNISSLAELGLVVILGIVAGACSAAFIHFLQFIATKTRGFAIWWRVLSAGVIMGVVGMLVPGVMGIGYDSVQMALNGELVLVMLLALLAAKIVATAVVIGLGVPGGMIGPTLFIGAMLGASVANIALYLPFETDTHSGVYALLGMGAMMSASLQAPLAALTAMLELTDSAEIILPGMLAVVVSGLTARVVFKKESLFVSMMKAAGQDYDANPVLQTLRRLGVAGIMERNFVMVNPQISYRLAREILQGNSQYILIEQENGEEILLPAVELAKFMEGDALVARHRDSETDEPEELVGDEMIDLLKIPAERLQAGAVSLQATCQEAFELLENSDYEALYVERNNRLQSRQVFGVLSKGMVEKAYRY